MISAKDITNILQGDNPQQTEKLAQAASRLTRQYFGQTISLYTPLYLSNYCSSGCTYCGFSRTHPITRTKLSPEQMEQEMSQIARSGIENILLLTGESYEMTPLSYLLQSVSMAKKYFPNISMEIYPLETEEYKELYFKGVDGITLYQETYNPKRYQEVHPVGKKRDFSYRYHAPERIAQSGIRHLSMGILLGLGDVCEDVFSLYEHLRFMEKHFPGVEYSLSFPRVRKVKGCTEQFSFVDDSVFLKIICLTRILFPRVGINLSTRETPHLRDHTLGLGITRISAGSRTSVGGYADHSPQEDTQFDIEDSRSVEDIISLLKEKNFDPVLTDWRRIINAPV